MQASTLTRLDLPPKAAMSCSALLSTAVVAGAVNPGVADPADVIEVAEPESSLRLARSSASNSPSGSRPGVRMFHFVMAKRNNR